MEDDSAVFAYRGMKSMVAIGLPAPCSGAFDCVHKDLADLFWSPVGVITVLAGIISLILFWKFIPKDKFKQKLAEKAFTVLATLIAVAFGLAFYSPIQQYNNLKGQYDDAIRSEEQRRFELERETMNRRIIEGQMAAVEEKLELLKKSVEKVQEKSEEIFRHLPKPKVSR